MAISFTRYVDITSSVQGGSQVPRRDLIGRIYSTNDLIPPQTLVTFDNAPEIGDYFGFDSEEYARGLYYFSFISKNSNSPQLLSFARWVDAAVAPMIFGGLPDTDVGDWTPITSGSFTLSIGGTPANFTSLDFSAVTSLADVATVVQTAINVNVGVQYATATVAYNALGPQFNFVGGSATATLDFKVIEGTAGTPIAAKLGWVGVGAIVGNGSAIETITQTLSSSAQTSDDFGSFAFMPSLTQDQIVEAATWNYGQDVKFLYTIPCTNLNATDLSEALVDLGGCSLTLSLTSGEYPEMLPMMILAATNYDAPNAVQNYMYQQSTLTPSVGTDADANTYDSLLVNYYGVTQSAGQFVAFYQRGFMFGPATSPSFMNIYANEIWLKDAIGASILNLLLAVGQVPANNQGISQVLTVIQTVINEALINGTISVNKKLTSTQIQAINAITNNPSAWYQVQTIGYWVNCTIDSFTANNSVTQFKANYTLVYSKDDVINKVTGQQILI